MTERLLPAEIDFGAPFPQISRRLRLGVVGGGRIASTQAMAARLTDRWEIVAGALSSDPESAKTRGAEWRLPPDRCYANFQDMATTEAKRADGVDAVMITTPNHVHFEAAKAFLGVGLDVLCDKPLTNDLSEAEELVRLADTSGCIFAVGYVMSCFAMVRQARAIVRSRGVGVVNQIHVEFLQDWMVPPGVEKSAHVQWRLDPEKSGPTSCTGDIGTHAAHLATFVTGFPMTDLRAEMHVCGAPKLLEDTVFMSTRYAGGAPGTLIATRLAPGNRGGLRLRVFGSEGGVEWLLETSEQLKHSRIGEPDRILTRGLGHGVSPCVERLVRTGRGFPEGLIEAWANLYTEFALAIAARRDGRDAPEDWLCLPTAEQGADGVRFIEAAVRSHQNGGTWRRL